MIVSVAIGVDNVPSSGKYEGRIVAVRPDGWQWGKEELKQFLILRINLGTAITDIRDAQRLTLMHFSDGILYDPNGLKMTQTVISKRRYVIPFTDIDSAANTAGKTVDWIKVKDTTQTYQPLKDTALPVTNMILDRYQSKKLSASDLTAIKSVGR